MEYQCSLQNFHMERFNCYQLLKCIYSILDKYTIVPAIIESMLNLNNTIGWTSVT
jgi:hypothetical protein